jgi:hypothetical protein
MRFKKCLARGFTALRGWRRNRRAENDHPIVPPGKISGDDAGKPEHAAAHAAKKRSVNPSSRSWVEPSQLFEPHPGILCLTSPRMKERMMKLKTIGAVVALVLAAGPATARHASSSQGQSIYCATREAGNPYSKYCDYQAWSEWRFRGGWDSRLDDACWRNPRYVPPGCRRR